MIYFFDTLTTDQLLFENNTSEANELGELGFKELYPDFKFNSLRECAERFHSNPKDALM
jgi:hypothetical protein